MHVSMGNVDELRSFEGKLELPYEGQNTQAFDDAVFSAPLNSVQLVESGWGFHLILVTERGSGERVIVAPETPVRFTPADVELRNDAGKSL